MIAGTVAVSDILDVIDYRIIHAVQVQCRAPFALIGQVIGVSEQTVARRYRRLESAGMLRVLGLPAPESIGYERWILRIQCRPDSAALLADALARRPDVNWVSLSAGGSEVVCNTRTRHDQQAQDLLLHRLPRTAEVQGLSAYSIMHHFDAAIEWTGYGNTLDDGQVARLTTAPAAGTGARLEPEDAALLSALGRDGRASLKVLAGHTGWSPSRVGRRIEQLHAAGAIYFDVDLDIARLGFNSMSHLWLTVAPSDLESVGAALIAHDEVAYCAAVTGSANLVAVAICRNSADLYRYVTTQVGALPAVRQVEISPLLRRVKQAGSMLTASGIARPPAS